MLDVANVDYWQIEDLEEREAKKKEHYSTIFKFWVEAIDLLATERLTHKYYAVNISSLAARRWKPDTGDCPAIKFDGAIPELSFLLIDSGDYFMLKLIVQVKNRQLDFWQTKVPYLVTDFEEKVYYLLPSLQDDKLVDWVSDYSNKLTILKIYFNDFYTHFLQQLLERYPVNYLPKKEKKPIPFDLSLIKIL